MQTLSMRLEFLKQFAACHTQHYNKNKTVHSQEGKGKGAYSSSWIGNLSQSYGASPAIWVRTVLHATQHR